MEVGGDEDVVTLRRERERVKIWDKIFCFQGGGSGTIPERVQRCWLGPVVWGSEDYQRILRREQQIFLGSRNRFLENT